MRTASYNYKNSIDIYSKYNFTSMLKTDLLYSGEATEGSGF